MVYINTYVWIVQSVVIVVGKCEIIFVNVEYNYKNFYIIKN